LVGAHAGPFVAALQSALMIEGMPDPKIHRICRRCQRWFYPEEGTLEAPEVTGPFGAMQAFRASIFADPRLLRFQCRRCTKVRRTTQQVLWVTLIGLVGSILILERLGFLH
jgi:hypothetical protein